jgi:hypothetical protein
MASLTGQSIKDTYQSLLKTDDNGLITNAFKGVTDGSGSASGLYLKNNGVLLSGSVTISGSLLYSGSTINATVTSASYALTASYAMNGGGGGSVDTGSFATTSSNVFVGNQTISGSINFGDGSIIQSTSASSGDGNGYTTLTLQPDTSLATDQYVVLDPTTPNHIHIRAGGIIDSSSAYLYLGGEKSNVVVRNLDNSFNEKHWVQINSQTGSTQYTWTFDDDGKLNMPGALEQGSGVVATGSYSHAEGNITQAIGDYSHAEGYETIASGSYSHAEGESTQAIGEYSHAEGQSTKTGTQNAYSASVTNGVITLSGSYGDITGEFAAENRLYLYDAPFDGSYGRETFIISQSYYSGSTNTIVELYDTSVNTTTAYVGDLNNIYSWNGDQTIPGDYSHAEGDNTRAVGNYSHAEGQEAISVGNYSHAEGEGSEAIGDYSHAEGNNTQAIGNWSHAEGAGTIASGSYSHAEGNFTKAIGQSSHAEGELTQAIGYTSHAEGQSTQAIGNYSHAEGYGTKTGTQNAYYAESVVSGVITLSGSYDDVSGEFAAENRLYLYDDPFDDNYGRATFIISQSYYSGSTNTIVELYDTSVNTATAYVGDLGQGIENWAGNQTIPGNYSHTEGSSTRAIGYASHAEGDQAQAIGNYSHAEGEAVQSIGESSHAEGRQTQAIGNSSHAEGYQTIASGSYSHAEGNITQAIGDYSHAEGDNTQALGDYSHAEGQEAIASGSYSHAEGYDTRAIGDRSHAEGNGTKTGTQNAYYAESVVNGVITLSGSYDDVSGQFGVGEDNRLYLYDAPFDAVYSRDVFIISQSYYDSTNTIVELYDTSVNTTTAYVGDLTNGEGINEWTGDQTIPGNYSHTEGELTQAIGESSHAEGYEAQASGYASHAEGNNSKSIGYASHAEGGNTKAIGNSSHAEGYQTIASGSHSHAEGNITQAIGDYSHAEGRYTIASGLYSHAEGYGTITVGDYSHAEGQSTQAIGNYSHAEGNGTKTGTQNAYYAESVVSGVITLSGSYGDVSGEFAAENRLYLYDIPFNDNYSRAIFIIRQSYFDSNNTIVELYDTGVNTTTAYVGDLGQGVNNWTGDQTIPGDYSHAEGSQTEAIGEASHAEGELTQAIGDYSHAEGFSTSAIGNYSHAEGEAVQAIGDRSHAEGYQTISSGSYSHAEGYQTQAIGQYSHTEGDQTIASGSHSHAEGYQTQAIGNYSHTEGENVIASGSYSHAEGYQTQAIGNWSHAEGEVTQAIGNWSHAEGNSTVASGSYSHAEGGSTQAIGEASHAEGGSTQAIGEASHAEGNATQAIGNYSHAEGQDTRAIGQGSHAEGLSTVASGSAQHVSGRYNQHNNPTSYFVVGIGLTEETRKDGFTVDVDANGSGSIMIPNNLNTPSVAKTGSMYVDPANNKLWIYTGNGGVGGWVTSSLG